MAEIAPLIEDYVKGLKRKGSIRSRAVERAFRLVPRHRFLESFYVWPGEPPRDSPHVCFIKKRLNPEDPDSQLLQLVYSDQALVTRLNDEGRPTSSTSQPALVAHMLEELDLKRGMKVLEIGAGTGYNAALMAEIVGQPTLITTIDVQADVVAQTKRLLEQAGYGGIHVPCHDGAHGAPEYAPYDRIVATVGCPDISWCWVEQLDEEGLMLIPLQHGGPHCDPLVKLSKKVGKDDHLVGKVVGWSGFMPIQGELADPVLWWSGAEPHPLELGNRPPDRSMPLFPALERAQLSEAACEVGEWAWYDFHYFLSLCDRRTFLGANAMGLVDPPRSNLVAITAEGIKLWGDAELFYDLKRVYARWEEMGRPKLTDWRVDFFPKTSAPPIPNEREGEIWVLDRSVSRQWAYLT